MVSVKYFARLREQFGRDGDRLEMVGDATVADIWSRVSGGRPLPANILMAVNQEYAQQTTPVKAGDEVAFFPPVTGG